MRRLKLITFALLAVVFVGSLPAQNLRDEVVTIPEKIWKKGKPKGKDIDDLIYMIQLNARYTLNTWYCDKTKFSSQEGKYIDFGGSNEPNIRPTSHNVFVMASIFKLGLYDEKIIGRPRSEAEEIFDRLLTSVLHHHKANGGTWGAWHWQSAMWSAQIAMGAWMVWEDLTPEQQEMTAKMVEFEANRFNNFKVPYYQDRDGVVKYKGDTKAEENAWNSGITTLAVLMLPNHPNYDKWYKKNIELQISAYATPNDLNSRKVVDGVVVGDILNGSNAYNDGTVHNHHILHPDYMTAIMFNVTNDWTCRMASKRPFKSSLYNCDLVYHALVHNKYDGKTMYCPTASGEASCEIYFPEGNDWGGERQANYWLMDIIADIHGLAKRDPIKPREWAMARSKEMLRMMSRDTTGQYYQSKKEDGFFSREQWIGQHLVWGYIGLWLDI